MNKRKIFFSFFLIVITFSLFAEKLTMIGIVDLTKIVSDYFKESTAWREIDELTNRVEQSTNEKLNEIRILQEQKINAANDNNEFLILKLEDEIQKKQQYLQEYHKIMSDRISSKKENLLTSSGFSKEIIESIQFIAENEGFSIVFRKKDPNILYYNYEVDITEKVIERLILRASSGN
ncbi:MAG: OmpH family outer membrane protein [Spirochaetales bacterium]|nr:OmpH family outer membrane protein [Spirochaetales bacterium]